MLDEQDLNQMREFILEQLPQLLHSNPEIALTIEGMLAQQFPIRDEFVRLLEQITLLAQELKLLRESTIRHLDLVDKRLAQVDRRFELIEKRLDRMDRRITLVEKRISQMDKRLEQIDRRIGQMEKRIVQIEQHLDLLQEEVNQFRDEMNKHFELLQAEMNKRFEEEKRERTQFDAWLKVVTGNIHAKREQEAEQLFALGLSYGLKRADIKPETLQLRQKFMDEEGIVFPKKGKHIEVDIMAEDGKLSVFEVKITALETDVVTFARKVQLIQHQNPDQKVSGIFISPDASEEIEQCCAEYELAFVG